MVAGTGRNPEPYLVYDLSSLVPFCCFAVHFEPSDLHVQYTFQERPAIYNQSPLVMCTLGTVRMYVAHRCSISLAFAAFARPAGIARMLWLSAIFSLSTSLPHAAAAAAPPLCTAKFSCRLFYGYSTIAWWIPGTIGIKCPVYTLTPETRMAMATPARVSYQLADGVRSCNEMLSQNLMLLIELSCAAFGAAKP